MKPEQKNRELHVSIIGSRMQIKGQIISTDDIRIDGFHCGNINTKGSVVIGTKGKINGNISARNILIQGNAMGEVEALENFSIDALGAFKGKVKTRYIKISEQAYFEGECQIETPGSMKEFDPEKKVGSAAFAAPLVKKQAGQSNGLFADEKSAPTQLNPPGSGEPDNSNPIDRKENHTKPAHSLLTKLLSNK
ncbi:bactofilin family protein [Gaoshiqia sp. Z1-71]|uniref:bactofilin family protein n=1 Tax=Gaoshiqia hydrogeniformans TaxID=3290090 RepID=UPI003BF7864F